MPLLQKNKKPMVKHSSPSHMRSSIAKNAHLKGKEKAMVGESIQWQVVVNEIHALANAPSFTSVLITGETGTGKEVVAKEIHETSDRRRYPFIAINCAAIPSDLLESMLFGYEKGAFTGAYAKTIGRFELAEGGTILLDEIGEMSLPLQAKLLRVLQEKSIDRVGGRESVPIDVRVIAATHCDLQRKVVNREFREDLYYRLNVYPIELPALRNRKEDIPLLLQHAAQNLAQKRYALLQFSSDSIATLQMYRWPGNVRELMNLVERLAVRGALEGVLKISSDDLPTEYRMATSDLVASEAVPEPGQDAELPSLETVHIVRPIPQGFHLGDYLRSVEQRIIIQALKQTSGNMLRAAQLLGIPRTTLISKVTKEDNN